MILDGKVSVISFTIWDNFELFSDWNVFMTFGLKSLDLPIEFYLNLLYSLTLEIELSDIDSLEVSICLS